MLPQNQLVYNSRGHNHSQQNENSSNENDVTRLSSFPTICPSLFDAIVSCFLKRMFGDYLLCHSFIIVRREHGTFLVER